MNFKKLDYTYILQRNVNLRYDDLLMLFVLLFFHDQEITRQYYAENPKDRQFLLYEHYRVAIEVEIPGSNHWNWCSLCTPEETFAGDIPMNQHFHERHAMIARKYACCKRTCKFETNYPSEYRYHVKNCTPQFKQMLGCDKEPTIIDSYADYIALREKSGHLLYLIKPGLPTCYGFSKQQPNTQGKLDQSQGETKKFWGPNKPRGPNDTPKKPNIKWRYAEPHQMDVLNKRPVDVSSVNKGFSFSNYHKLHNLILENLIPFLLGVHKTSSCKFQITKEFPNFTRQAFANLCEQTTIRYKTKSCTCCR